MSPIEPKVARPFLMKLKGREQLIDFIVTATNNSYASPSFTKRKNGLVIGKLAKETLVGWEGPVYYFALIVRHREFFFLDLKETPFTENEMAEMENRLFGIKR